MPCMPTFIKVSDWQQTQTNINFKIPSHGICINHIDFLICEKYIKTHYQQFIFEIFLWESIDISKSTCVVTDKDIIFELNKSVTETWDKLEADIDKAEKKERRKEANEEYQKRSEEERSMKEKQKAELKRTAVKEQIVLDTKKHDYIKTVKNTEKEKALKELQLWEQNKSIKELTIQEENPKIKQTFKKSTDHSKYKSSDKPKEIEKAPEEIKIPEIPMPRRCLNINISFTSRDFPTPMRESKSEEENEWLAKQAAARRSTGFDSKDLLPEERNPQWLKAKGDEFFKAKNYLGAISAYTEGINISKDFVDLYINRSAVHMIVGNLQRTIDDCSKALEIMTPPIPANLEMRAICIARRGASLCKLGLDKQGKKELEIALTLVRNNEDLKQEIERIQKGFGFE